MVTYMIEVAQSGAQIGNLFVIFPVGIVAEKARRTFDSRIVESLEEGMRHETRDTENSQPVIARAEHIQRAVPAAGKSHAFAHGLVFLVKMRYGNGGLRTVGRASRPEGIKARAVHPAKNGHKLRSVGIRADVFFVDMAYQFDAVFTAP